MQERHKVPPRAKSRAAWAALKSPLPDSGMLQMPADMRGRSEYRSDYRPYYKLASLGELKRNRRITKLQEEYNNGMKIICNNYFFPWRIRYKKVSELLPNLLTSINPVSKCTFFPKHYAVLFLHHGSEAGMEVSRINEVSK